MKTKLFFLIVTGLIIYGLFGVIGGVGIATKESTWGLFAFTPAVWFLISVIYFSLFPNKKRRTKSHTPAPASFNFK